MAFSRFICSKNTIMVADIKNGPNGISEFIFVRLAAIKISENIAPAVFARNNTMNELSHESKNAIATPNLTSPKPTKCRPVFSPTR
jgi:hypothetical protein